MRKRTKHYIILAVFIALAAVLSLVDNYVSFGVKTLIPLLGTFVPNFKFGFANVAILVILLNYRFHEGLFAILLKSTIVGFLFGAGLVTFIIGLCGSVLSYVIMWVLLKVLNRKFLIIISAIGGMTHALGQIIGAFAIYQMDIEVMLIYAPFFLIMGFITGLAIGYLAKKANAVLVKVGHQTGIHNQSSHQM